MPLLSIIRSLSFRRLSNNTNDNTTSTDRELRPRPSCEHRASLMRECLTQSSADGILLPPPKDDTHRRASRRVRGRHISFDATTEAHQHYKSLGYPRTPAFSVEDPVREYVPRPAHCSRTYHIMYEGCEGPIIQDAMYMSIMQVILPEPTQTPNFAPPEAPVLPSIESFATIKHHAMNDDLSLETFTPSPSPPSTPKSQRTRSPTLAGATPGQTLFLPSPRHDSPASRRTPEQRERRNTELDDTPTRKTPTFKRLQESVSMQAVLGLSLSVSTSFDSTANFAMGLVVASESKDSGRMGVGMGTWDSVKEMEERVRAQTASF